MHVEISTDPGKVPKHAGQKKTYKAIAETYAFLPREAVTHFLMSCGECQKRMHISTTGQDYKENDQPRSLASEVIDYNMPLTTTYMKQLKLQCMSNNKVREAAVNQLETLCDMSSGGSILPHPAPSLRPLSPSHIHPSTHSDTQTHTDTHS
uniref:Nucleolar protein 4-like b n=1 Tax=Echeneis naucrates TaxID=173247 RepID=A0A665VPF6_ECHNA